MKKSGVFISVTAPQKDEEVILAEQILHDGEQRQLTDMQGTYYVRQIRYCIKLNTSLPHVPA